MKVRCKKVKGFPGYKVGENGSVWSKHLAKRLGAAGGEGKWRKLKQSWRGGKIKYKSITLYKNKKPYPFLVHQLVLTAFVGPCPPGMEACHFPDRNPENNHLNNLRWGTKSENMGDAVKHGTTTKGEKNARAELTEEQVREIIRFRSEEGIGCRRLGRMYGVSSATIQNILSGLSWTHVPRPENWAKTRIGNLNSSAKINNNKAMKVVKLYKNGWSQEKIARKVGLTQTAVSLILSGNTWNHVTGIQVGQKWKTKRYLVS